MDGRAASQTITDKIPHLLNRGIEPIIVSGMTGEKDNVIEHHQILPALPVALRFDLRHYLKQRISNPIVYRLAMSLISTTLLPFYLIEKFVIPIETHWSWAITAYFTSSRIIQKRKPTFIYSTGGAYAAHLAAYWLAKRFNLPWIAEIHDPMIYPGLSSNNRRKFFAAWLEGIICKHADVAWWFTEKALMNARTRHPVLGDRGHFVVPGADKPEFFRKPYQRNKQFIIGHFGTLDPTRNLEIFLLGLHLALEKKHHWKDSIRIHLYGSRIDSISARALKKFPYPSVIKQFGRLEFDPETNESGREQVIKHMNAVDCLLLLHGNAPSCEEYIPSKVYEYLWTQRPILALIWHNTQMEKMLHEQGHWVVKSDDVVAIATTLETLHLHWTQDKLTDSEKNSPYTMEAATHQIINMAQSSLRSNTSQIISKQVTLDLP